MTLTLYFAMPNLKMILVKKPLKITVGKGENAAGQHFLFFP